MTKEDYFAGIDWIERVKPDHPMLNTLRGGHTKINELYIKRILQDIGQAPKERLKRFEEKEPDVDLMDPDYIDLSRRIATLFGMRRRLSNSFHTCKSDEEAAAVSLEISQVQGKLSKCYRMKREYQRTGFIPLESEVEEEELPTGVTLSRSMNANCKRRSYYRNQIKSHQGSKDPRTPAKIAEWEKKLKEDELEYELLKRALAREAL